MQPENTLASFQAAADRGATWVEFDVRPTKDAVLAIHHDPDTTDGLRLASHRYDELDESIPTFGELVAALPEMGLDIEIKADEVGITLDHYVELVVSELDQHCAGRDDIMVTSFEHAFLERLRAVRPEIRTGLLFLERDADPVIRRAVDLGHEAIAPWIKVLTPELVASAREAGLEIATWTVNEPSQVRLASDLGVDMIIGDDPAVILDHL